MKKFTGQTLFVIAVVTVVVATVVLGLFMAGSPTKERERRMDEQRVSNLQNVVSAVDTYWNQQRVLPSSLDILQTTPGIYIDTLRDPSTGQPFAYRMLSQNQYELCAVFESDTTVQTNQTPPYAPYPFGAPNFAKHGVGRTCFTVRVQDLQVKTP